jgi:hypothetical protein
LLIAVAVGIGQRLRPRRSNFSHAGFFLAVLASLI